MSHYHQLGNPLLDAEVGRSSPDPGHRPSSSSGGGSHPSRRSIAWGSSVFIHNAAKFLRSSGSRAQTDLENEAAKLFAHVKALSTSSLDDNHIQFGDLVQAFRLFQFELTFTAVAMKRQVDQEEAAVQEFMFHLGRVCDIINQRMASIDVVWNEERETERLDAASLHELYCVLHDPNLISPASRFRDALRLGSAHCARLRALFFHHSIDQACATLAAKSGIFATLFMHFEVNTESGAQDAQLSMGEIFEMLQVLGFDRAQLGIDDGSPSESRVDREPCTAKHGDFGPNAKCIVPTALNMLSSRVGDGMAQDREELRPRAAGRPAVSPGQGLQPCLPSASSSRAVNRFRSLVHMAKQNGADLPSSVATTPSSREDARPEDRSRVESLLLLGMQSLEEERRRDLELSAVLQDDQPNAATTPAKKIAKYFSTRGMAELKRPEFASLCLYLMSPSADSTLVTQSASIRSSSQADVPSRTFAYLFRHRACLLYESAEGIESTFDAASFAKYFLVGVGFPVGFVWWVVRAHRKQQALGASSERASDDVAARLNFRRILAAYVFGSLLWFFLFLPPMIARNRESCVTWFELYYPLLCGFFGILGTASYLSFQARTIRPGTFKRHRVAVELRACACVQRIFESGQDTVVSAMDLVSGDAQLLRVDSRRPGAGGLRHLFAGVYLNQLTRSGRKLWWGVSLMIAMLVAFIPTMVRARYGASTCPEDDATCVVYKYTACSNAQQEFAAVVYTFTGFLSTMFISAVLLRVFVQLSHIRWSWLMFSGLHNPIRARERKQRNFFLKASPAAGRLDGFLDLRKAENVRAWSKIRLYMQLAFQDELRGVEIILAFALVLLIAAIATTFAVFFVFVLSGSKDSSGEKEGNWKYYVLQSLPLLVASVFGGPLVMVLYNGVAINEELRKHIPSLARTRHNVEEEYAEAVAAGGAASDAATMLGLSKSMLASLVDVLRESDTSLRVLGVELSMPLLRTLVFAIFTSIVTSVAKTIDFGFK